jgi:peptidoglycan/xylan/chitin deacetylase (PgdA/CDA1 family)
MKASIVLIWDFDGMIGQINSSMAYSWDDFNAEQEQVNARYIQDLAIKYGYAQCFAATGISATSLIDGFSLANTLAYLNNNGSEIASHSWKHEWFPSLTVEQARESLAASKAALENLFANKQIAGFVPPFTRPMTWFKRGNFSLGDRFLYPFFPLGDQGNLVKLASNVGYKWIRVKERPIYLKWSSRQVLHQPFYSNNMLCIPNHATGFDNKTKQLLDLAIKENLIFVINGHPLGLSREGIENIKLFNDFIHQLLRLRDGNKIDIITPSKLKV